MINKESNVSLPGHDLCFWMNALPKVECGQSLFSFSLQDGGTIGLELGVGKSSVGIEGGDVGVDLDSLSVLFDSVVILFV